MWKSEVKGQVHCNFVQLIFECCNLYKYDIHSVEITIVKVIWANTFAIQTEWQVIFVDKECMFLS